MNRALPYAALFLALLALGCGGSSTGSSTPSSVVGVTYANPTIEAVLYAAGGAVNTSAPVVEDTMNIQTGELVDFQVVAYDSAGVRHVLPGTDFRWSDSSNQFGILDPASGLFQVGSSAMSTRYIINATYNGKTVAAYYQVNPYQARVIGKVIGSDTAAGAKGVGITFYAADKSVAGYVVSSYDGTFRASVKSTATTFSVDPNTVGTNYWQSFTYGLNPAYATDPTQTQLYSYDAGSDSCDASFQTMYRRDGSQIGSSLIVGENFLFIPTQPSSLLVPVVPASSTDPGIIIVNARSSARPNSNGCTG